MTANEHLAALIKKAAYINLPSDTSNEHLNKFTDCLIAHGVTVQGWISVKDRLPEKEGTYIVHGNLGGVFGMFYDHLLSNSFKQMVTHWMPMPEPPEGE